MRWWKVGEKNGLDEKIEFLPDASSHLFHAVVFKYTNINVMRSVGYSNFKADAVVVVIT